MNLEEARIQSKLAGLRKKWLVAKTKDRVILELQAKTLKLALDELHKNGGDVRN